MGDTLGIEHSASSRSATASVAGFGLSPGPILAKGGRDPETDQDSACGWFGDGDCHDFSRHGLFGASGMERRGVNGCR